MADQAFKLHEIKPGMWINPAAVAMAECVGGVKKYDPATKDFTDYYELTLTLWGGSSVTLTDTTEIQKLVALLGLDEVEKWPPPQE
jgi:hypothetical protein